MGSGCQGHQAPAVSCRRPPPAVRSTAADGCPAAAAAGNPADRRPVRPAREPGTHGRPRHTVLIQPAVRRRERGHDRILRTNGRRGTDRSGADRFLWDGRWALRWSGTSSSVRPAAGPRTTRLTTADLTWAAAGGAGEIGAGPAGRAGPADNSVAGRIGPGRRGACSLGGRPSSPARRGRMEERSAAAVEPRADPEPWSADLPARRTRCSAERSGRSAAPAGGRSDLRAGRKQDRLAGRSRRSRDRDRTRSPPHPAPRRAAHVLGWPMAEGKSSGVPCGKMDW